MNTSSNPALTNSAKRARASVASVVPKAHPRVLTRKKIRGSILTDDETIAAPAPLLWFCRATRRHRIQREVTENRPRVGAVPDKEPQSQRPKTMFTAGSIQWGMILRAG